MYGTGCCSVTEAKQRDQIDFEGSCADISLSALHARVCYSLICCVFRACTYVHA